MYVMGSEPGAELTFENAEFVVKNVESEEEIASWFAIIHNKAWWLDDEVYDYPRGSAEYEQISKETDR